MTKMDEKNKPVVVIPALSESVVEEFNGSPLIVWTVSQALKSDVDKVVVVSKLKSVTVALEPFIDKIDLVDLPKELEKASEDEIIVYYSDFWYKKHNVVVTLNVNQPLRTSEDINEAISTLLAHNLPVVCGINKGLDRIANIGVIRRNVLLTKKRFRCEGMGFLILPNYKTIDDVYICDALYNNNFFTSQQKA